MLKYPISEIHNQGLPVTLRSEWSLEHIEPRVKSCQHSPPSVSLSLGVRVSSESPVCPQSGSDTLPSHTSWQNTVHSDLERERRDDLMSRLYINVLQLIYRGVLSLLFTGDLKQKCKITSLYDFCLLFLSKSSAISFTKYIWLKYTVSVLKLLWCFIFVLATCKPLFWAIRYFVAELDPHHSKIF